MRDRRYSRVAFSQLYACEDQFDLLWQWVRCHTRRSLERKQPRVERGTRYPRATVRTHVKYLTGAITPSSKRTRSFVKNRGETRWMKLLPVALMEPVRYKKQKITQGNKVRGVVKKRWIYGQF
jgi:hypothetical protein